MGRLAAFLCCCVFWIAVLWVVMVLRDHSRERQTCIFVVESEEGANSLWVVLDLMGEEKCVVSRLSEGKWWCSMDEKGEMNVICYITWPVFQDFSAWAVCFLYIFTAKNKSVGQQNALHVVIYGSGAVALCTEIKVLFTVLWYCNKIK